MRICLLLVLVFVWGLGGIARAGLALQEQLSAESQRREEQIKPLQQAWAQGNKLAAQGEIQRAWEGLNQAFQETPEALRRTATGVKVQQTLAGWEARMAENESKLSHWPKARDWALLSLQKDPNNPSAKAILEEANTVLRRGAVAGEEINPALNNRFLKSCRVFKAV